MNKYFQSKLYDLNPYIPGEQPGVRKKVIKLNTNENPYPPSPKIKKVVDDILNKGLLRKYPNPTSESLTEALAEIYQVDKNMILITNGSDEGLALLFKATLGPKSKLVMPYPTYSLYPVLSDIQMNLVKINKIPLTENLHFDFNKLEKAKGNLLTFAHPNAPTGIKEERINLLNLINNFQGIVLCDEAYIDFAPTGTSLIDEVKNFDNLVISRTFSKSYSLAGLRAGFLVSNKANIELLNKLKDSYNLGMLEQAIAKTSILDNKYFEKNIQKIINSRKKLTNELEKLSFIVTPSDTNFLFVKPPHSVKPEDLFINLREKGIYIRYFKDEFCKNYLRITVGSEIENNIFLKQVREFLNKK